MPVEAWITIAGVVGTIITTAGAALYGRIRKVEQAIIELQTQMSPFSDAAFKIVSDSLHKPSPNHREQDKLLEQMLDGTIQEAGVELLKETVLKTSENPEKSQEERDNSTRYLAVLKGREALAVIETLPPVIKSEEKKDEAK